MRPTPADLVLIALAGLLLGALYAIYWSAPVAADRFELREAGRVVGEYSLAIDRRLEVAGRLGVSVIEVRGHRVRFAHSPCRNQICTHGGWLSHGGEVVACLPNRISIRLRGAERDAVDAVSF